MKNELIEALKDSTSYIAAYKCQCNYEDGGGQCPRCFIVERNQKALESAKAEVQSGESTPLVNGIEVEVVCNGEVHYRRPWNDRLVQDALKTSGYSIRVHGLDTGKIQNTSDKAQSDEEWDRSGRTPQQMWDEIQEIRKITGDDGTFGNPHVLVKEMADELMRLGYKGPYWDDAPDQQSGENDYVAWLHWNGHTFVTCDSDSQGAFKVYRHNQKQSGEVVSRETIENAWHKAPTFETALDAIYALQLRAPTFEVPSLDLGKVCHWDQQEEDSDTWSTSCGQKYSIIYGTPEENGHKFCHHCGKPMVQHLFEIELDDDLESQAKGAQG